VETHLTPDQRPKIFYTNSSGEYWGGGRATALVHATLDSQEDVKLPDNVRVYLVAGTQHVPGGFLPSQGEGQQRPNGNEYSWALRALLVGLDRWVREGVEPPASPHPRLADHTLVPESIIKFSAMLREGEDAYERNNRWMLESALGFGSEKVEFVCLWDGEGGDGPGGTRHMMDAVRNQGGRTRWLDTTKLWR